MIKYLFKILLITFFSVNTVYSQNDVEGNPFPEEILNSKLFNESGETLIVNQLIEENKGKIIYIDFWASWCRSCLKEMPYSNELNNKFSDDEVIFIYISTDENDKDWKSGLTKMKNYGINYRIDISSKPALQDYLNIKGIPYILIFDKQGNVTKKNAIYPSSTKAEKELNKILNQN